MYGGGAERTISDITCGFAELSADITCQIVAITDDPTMYSLSQEIISLGLRFPKKNQHFYYVRLLLYYLRATFRYHRLLRQNNIDVSISSVYETPRINYLACIGTKCKSIQTRHSTYSSSLFLNEKKSIIINIFSWFMINFVYNRAERVTAVSNGVRDDLIHWGVDSNKIVTIYNPLNIDKIIQDSKEAVDSPLFETDIPILITAGRLVPVKGQWHLIRIFSEIRKKIVCKLVICGEGELLESLQKLVSDYNLQDDVVFLGWVPNPYKYYAKSTLFVLTSLSEGYGNVLVEAMTCGCPVISTNCKYGPAEILDNGHYGILSEPLDNRYYETNTPLTPEENDMKEKILNLLNNKELLEKYSALGLERVQCYRRENAIKKYTDLIYEVS